MDPNPWIQIVNSLKVNRNKLVPMRWGLAILIAAKAYLHF